MSKIKKQHSAVILVLASLSHTVVASPPQMLPLQGQLRDAAGAPVTGVAQLRFVLYTQDGEVLHAETVETTIVDGAFTLYLGAGSESLDLALFQAHPSVFLGVAIDGGTEMNPRIKVATAPFAAYAAFADEAQMLAGGYTAEDFAHAGAIEWSELVNVPTGLSDGDDDSLAGLSCSSGDFASWNGTGWQCFSGSGGPGTGIANINANSPLTGGGNTTSVDLGISVGSGDNQVAAGNHDHNSLYPATAETLAGMNCVLGEIAKWGDSGWSCSRDHYLDEAEVDSYVEDNGFAALSLLAAVATSGAFTELNNIPFGLADGDDDTLAALGCEADQVVQWDGAGEHWSCADGKFWLRSGNIGTTAGVDYLGTSDNTALELAANGARVLLLEPETTVDGPNMIGGFSGNTRGEGVVGGVISGGGFSSNQNAVYDDYGTIGGGYSNVVGIDDGPGNYSPPSAPTVGGGSDNLASGGSATVGGGRSNTAHLYAATVGGGAYNNAFGANACVGCGSLNEATGDNSTVSGGSGNRAIGDFSTVAGGGPGNPFGPGSENIAWDDYSSIGGGGHNRAGSDDGATQNTTNAKYATIGGGGDNTAGALWATVSGGRGNAALAAYSTICGGGPSDPGSDPLGTTNRAYDNYGSIGGGGENRVGSDDGVSQIPTNATFATVSGGRANSAGQEYATVSGGANNSATAAITTVSGGIRNVAFEYGATVGGGLENQALGYYTSIGGGSSNQSSGYHSTIGGGSQNRVTTAPLPAVVQKILLALAMRMLSGMITALWAEAAPIALAVTMVHPKTRATHAMPQLPEVPTTTLLARVRLFLGGLTMTLQGAGLRSLEAPQT